MTPQAQLAGTGVRVGQCDPKLQPTCLSMLRFPRASETLRTGNMVCTLQIPQGRVCPLPSHPGPLPTQVKDSKTVPSPTRSLNRGPGSKKIPLRRNRKPPAGFCVNLPAVSAKPAVEGTLAGEVLKAAGRTALSSGLCQSVPEPLTGPPQLSALSPKYYVCRDTKQSLPQLWNLEATYVPEPFTIT